MALEKPLKGKLYIGSSDSSIAVLPTDFKGNFTGRLAKDCRTHDDIVYDSLKGLGYVNNLFIDNCLSKRSKKPLVAFSGDSHSSKLFPISELIASTNKYYVFSHGRAGCAFPPQGETNRKNCFSVQSSIMESVINEIKKRNSGSAVVATSYLQTHFGYDGIHRYQFMKFPDGSRFSVDKNLEDFVT